MLRTLQAGRGLAALAVAAFHLSLTFSDPWPGQQLVFWGATSRMSLGVDFFFVLSGFIILFAHRRDIGIPGRVGNYGFKRLVRVYPVYWFVTAGLVVATTIKGGTAHVPANVGEIASTVTLVRLAPGGVPIGAAWTLFHEVLFYALFALLIVDRRLGVLALTLWAGLVLVLFDYAAHGPLSIWTTLISARNLGFFFGMGAYFIAGKLRAGAAGLTGLAGAVIVAGDLIFEARLGGSNLSHVGYSIGFMALIAGLVALERERKVIAIPVLGLLGDASYSLYLIHENLERLMIQGATRLHARDWIDARLLYVILLAGTVVIAVVFHKLIEKPLVRAGQRWQASRSRRSEADGGLAEAPTR